MPDDRPFWKRKRLAEMTAAEWESLCDGCGRCCLHKIRWADEHGTEGELAHTNVACRLLDLKSCSCRDYANRHEIVPDCTPLTVENVPHLDWLPQSCAYRRVAQGRDLAWWHHLVCGDREMVHKAGASVRGRAVREGRGRHLEHHIVAWPGEPVRARKPKDLP